MPWSRAALSALLLVLASTGRAQQPPPNVILILTDDQGTADLGAAGTADVHTPAMDALAARGLRFTRFYAAAPICSPSRAAVLTGRVPQRCGVPGNVGPGGPGLPLEELTIAEHFRGHGYATAILGKWHLGSRPEEGPLRQGFDHFFGHKQGCIDNWSHYFFWNGPNRHDLWRDEKEVWEEGRYFGDLLVREAVGFLRSHRDRPFFLYLPWNSPHYPLQGRARWRDFFAGQPAPRRDYLAMLATLDEDIGRILAEVDRLGLRERTIVALQSDHGHSTEVRSFSGGGSSGGLRGAKFSLFEGGIRVPALISWPGHLPAGELRQQPAHAADWFPTLAELCGLPPPRRRLDGRSLARVLRDASASRPHEVLHWQSGEQWAVRKGPWKLIHAPRDTDGRRLGEADETWLDRVEDDPAEEQNLAAQEPGIVQELTALHESWRADTDRPEARALVLGLDGVRGDALRVADTPNLDSLAATGSITFRARNVEVSGHSAPNWASLLTGAGVERHGLSANGDHEGELDRWPHFFLRLRRRLPWLGLASLVQWTPIHEDMLPAGVADVRFPPAEEAPPQGDAGRRVAAAAAALLAGRGPVAAEEVGAVFVHLDGADEAGHAHGYSPDEPAYLAAIERVDGRVGEILAALRARPGYRSGREDWLILVTTDHGGYGLAGEGTGHSITGDPERDEAVRRCWWILSRPSRPPGGDLGAPRITDVAATVLDHFGVDPAAAGLEGRSRLPAPPPEAVAPEAGPLFRFEEASGLGPAQGLVRRDPSDVVPWQGRDHVWYTRVEAGAPDFPEGYGGVIWHASSADQGRHWREEGLALGPGPPDAFDGHGVFTPGILHHGDHWYLYYTGVARGFRNDAVAAAGRTAIGVAVADAPEGPWRRRPEPVLESTWDRPWRFDSFRVDDACLAATADGVRLYFKGRSARHGPGGPRRTRMGLALAEQPLGPFRRSASGVPIQDSGHEVLVWRQAGSWWSLVAATGPRGRTLRRSADGLDFDQGWVLPLGSGETLPAAPGLHRPERTGAAEADARAPRWGLCMLRRDGAIGLQRFEFTLPAALAARR